MKTKVSFINFNPSSKERKSMELFLNRISKRYPKTANVICEIEKIYNDFALSFKLQTDNYTVEKASAGKNLEQAKEGLDLQLKQELSWRKYRLNRSEPKVVGGQYGGA